MSVLKAAKWLWPDRAAGSAGDWFAQLLAERGITDVAIQAEYLSDRPQETWDPFLLNDMKEAAKRILLAIDRQEVIYIYGDYDADGICAAALLSQIVEALGGQSSCYIPSRFDEGYGLNYDALDWIAAQGGNLVVTVDCGSVSLAEVRHARSIGLDIIVTDHHNPGDTLPDCLVVNPKRSDSAYPCPHLSGCGVAFKLAQALQRLSGHLDRRELNRVLDLVAIATIADIVPLIGENRTLVKYGIREISRQNRPGLKKLIEAVGLKSDRIQSDQIAYVIAPHLNAGGRIATAETGLDLLRSNDEKHIASAVEELCHNNRTRRQIQEKALTVAIDLAVGQIAQDRPILILTAPEGVIHEGIAGIVAGKIKDRYQRPALVLTETDGDSLKGSGRSVAGVDLHQLLSSAAGLFEKFGGHSGACGFTLPKNSLSEMSSLVTKAMQRLLEEDPACLTPILKIDAVTAARDVNVGMLEQLDRMEPFGRGNERPLLCLNGVVTKNPVFMGELGQHVRFQADGLDCVCFQKGEIFRDWITAGEKLRLAGHPGWNEWNGSRKIQFVVTDIQCYNSSN